jgi:hypothetical protein
MSYDIPLPDNRTPRNLQNALVGKPQTFAALPHPEFLAVVQLHSEAKYSLDRFDRIHLLQILEGDALPVAYPKDSQHRDYWAA